MVGHVFHPMPANAPKVGQESIVKLVSHLNKSSLYHSANVSISVLFSGWKSFRKVILTAGTDLVDNRG